MPDRVLELPGKIKPYVMAHRGNRAVCPENTLASFRHALQDGADILETDLHLSADGVFLCIHDGTLDRTTTGTGPVAEQTLAQVKAVSAGKGWPGFEGETVPTLAELGAILPPDVAIALELKTDRFLEPEVCRRLAAELDGLGLLERSVVLSFSQARLAAVRAHAPAIPTGWITLSRWLPLPGVDMLGPFYPLLTLNPFYVRVAHRRGQLVCPLDPNPDARLNRYLRLGVDAVLTDNPASTATRLRQLQPARR
jgi:glycerophosphoryl diester phosphodiesterase